MARVCCAAVECKWNDDCLCRAKSINLSDGHVHTVHQGFKHIWTCKEFEMSAFAKEVAAAMSEIVRGDEQ